MYGAQLGASKEKSSNASKENLSTASAVKDEAAGDLSRMTSTSGRVVVGLVALGSIVGALAYLFLFSLPHSAWMPNWSHLLTWKVPGISSERLKANLKVRLMASVIFFSSLSNIKYEMRFANRVKLIIKLMMPLLWFYEKQTSHDNELSHYWLQNAESKSF